MASARPSTYRKGGGFLNDVDATITDYEFTTESPWEGKGKSKSKNKDFSPLYTLLTVRQDGAEEDSQTTLFFGSADDWEISKDGKTLTPVDEAFSPSARSAWGKFIGSLCEVSPDVFSEDDLPEDEVNYEPIIGLRAHFTQQVNQEATTKYGKRKGKGKATYDRTDLVVTEVYETGTAEKANGKAKTKAASTSVKSKGSPNKASAKTKHDDEENELQELADETLLAILADKDGSIERKRLSIEITKRMMKHPQRDAVRELVYSDDYLTGAEDRELITFDQKKQIIVST